MSVLALIIPDRYPFVVAAGVSTFWVTQWQGFLVGRSRKAAGIKYPQAYAEKAEVASSKAAMVFNCAQRAHQNTLETIPHVLFAILFSGLRYPTIAASLGGVYALGRILYTRGYMSGNPDNRGKKGGFLAPLSTLGLLLASTVTAGQMVWEYFQY